MKLEEYCHINNPDTFERIQWAILEEQSELEERTDEKANGIFW